MTPYSSCPTRCPWLVCAAVCAVTVLLGWSAWRIKIDLDPELELPRSHPFIEADRAIAAEFGGKNPIVVAIVPRRGTIWSVPILARLHRMTRAVLNLPGVIRENVLSLAAPSARRVESLNGTLKEDYLMREPPTTAEEIEALRRAYQAVPMYQGLLVSHDEMAALLFVDFWSTAEALKNAPRIIALADRLSTPDIGIHVTGSPIIQLSDRRNLASMPQRLAAGFCLIAVVLWAAFGSLQGAFVPLTTALLSVVWDLGLMSLTGIPITTWNSSVPILVLAVAAGHSTQMLRRYHEVAATAADSRAAVRETMRTMGPVMLAAGGTTAGGFAALSIFRLPSLTRFGLSAALGIASAVALEFTLIPALRTLLPLPPAGASRFGRWIPAERLSAWLWRHPAAITFVFTTFTAAAAALVPSVPVGGSTRRYLPAASRARRDLEAISAHFRGTATMNVLISTPSSEILSPASVLTMQRIEKVLSESSGVAATASAAGVLRQAYGTFVGATQVSLPSDPRTLAQIAFLAGGGLERFVDRRRSRAVVWAYLESDDAQAASRLLQRLRTELSAQPPPAPVRVTLAGGTAPVALAINEQAARGKATNAGLLLVLIALVAAVVFRSLAAGLLVVIPLVTTGFLSLGLLAAAGLYLDVVTTSVISVGVAIGADYSIYLLYRWRQEIASARDVRAALCATLRSAGSAIGFVAGAVSAGFLSLASSPYLAFRLASLLVAFATVTSALAALVFLPAVALLWRPQALFAAGRGGTAVSSSRAS